MPTPLDSFSPHVRRWFLENLGEPTPPQAQGWPPIQRGENTLLLSPTGSGKTIAAFLWAIDRIYQEKRGEEEQVETQPRATKGQSRRRPGKGGRAESGPPSSGVRLLYVSPLKALNNDIERNLQAPVEGIRAVAARAGEHLPPLRVMVRTGDTPSSVRQQMLKQPPDILITTPESLYLMLTSPRARNMFRTVRSLIVDEIHTLVGSKRGAHLALSLERLEELAGHPIQRIGLSATIRPLEEAARWLGGQVQAPGGILTPRPVTIVNAHYPKALDLKVITVVDDFREVPGDTIWPSIVPQVLDDVRRHKTTLIFANNRRLAERTADRLNAQLAAEQSEEIPPGGLALLPDGVAHDRGIFALGVEGPFRAHHGSMSKEARREMEEQLKAGELPALVGTSSLELGIDIGAVDLVVQLQSPKSVAQGLQRVGRSGHLVGQTSRGRIYPTFREDLAEAAAIVRGMLEGDVELTYSPQNPLDVLAQQIVAMVAMEEWSLPALYDLVRRAYPYQDLSEKAFRSVLEMLSGRYYLDAAAKSSRPASALRAKIAWDRVHDRLAALPGSRMLAMGNVGTIPDTGQFGVYLADGKTRIGDLDEEFVFETREGDVFLLGSNVWRVQQITDDRIVVSDAGGATPRMPFWHGDLPYRPYELGARIGRFRREVAERIEKDPENLQPVEDWLQREYALDARSAHNLVLHVKHQLDAVGVISSDSAIVVESFQNAVGDPYLVIHSPFGGRVNGAWAVAVSSALRERSGVDVETQANDDGVIIRFPQSDREPPVDVIARMSPAEARERILRELPNSAVFGAHFRMNAARALLLPRSRAGKRTPFWLQRMKAKDLLALVRRFDDFPIVTETYRDVLADVFDLPHLEQVLERIASGAIRVVPIETAVPSPVATGLLFNFVSVYIYEWDTPKAERALHVLSQRREALQDVLKDIELSELLKPEAIAEVTGRAQHLAPGYQARSMEELAVDLAELGDLAKDEILARCAGDGASWLRQLAEQDRIVEIPIPSATGVERRWVVAELAAEYRALAETGDHEQEQEEILRRFLRRAGPVTRSEILARYAFPESWLGETIARLVAAGAWAAGHFTKRDREEICDSHLLEQIHRRTLTLLRREIQPVPLDTYSHFLTLWQHASLGTRLTGSAGARQALEQLRGLAAPATTWGHDVLPARLAQYDSSDLAALGSEGEIVWVGSGRDPRRGKLRLFFRGEGGLFLPPADESGLSPEAAAVYEFLKGEGASFPADIEAALGYRHANVINALLELAMAGLVTNDSPETLRKLIDEGIPASQPDESESRAPLSPLEEELASRLGGGSRPLTRTRYNEAKRRVGHRLNAGPGPTVWSGRWTPVHRVGILGPPRSPQERAERYARVLLARYGIVTREALDHEETIWDWADLYPVLERMELRGEIRRGYFVSGLPGVQFALPEAVEKLRAAEAAADDSLVVLSSADPANLFGPELADCPIDEDGKPLRFARLPSTHIVLSRGRPVLLAEDNGDRITTLAGVSSDLVARALGAYARRPYAGRHIVVSKWNGESVLGGPGQPMLERIGFYKTPSGMEWWANR